MNRIYAYRNEYLQSHKKRSLWYRQLQRDPIFLFLWRIVDDLSIREVSYELLDLLGLDDLYIWLLLLESPILILSIGQLLVLDVLVLINVVGIGDHVIRIVVVLLLGVYAAWIHDIVVLLRGNICATTTHNLLVHILIILL